VSRRIATSAVLTAALCLAALGASQAAAAGLIAPPAACPEVRGGAEAEEASMLCMTNYARAHAGEAPLEADATLAASAREKSEDIFRCDSFSHYACGREFTYWIRASGYLSSECWRAGENLAWGSGSYGTVRSIFRAWMRSTEHRANILGDFAQIGIDRDFGTLEGRPGTDVWTQHFGSHCEAPAAS
jgi:uncharacterized protein YkwD